ncbi:unnamed protein product [Rotaria sp. Silwood1]|nr:unnamed protein product [Rotaria sp. Silwood1]
MKIFHDETITTTKSIFIETSKKNKKKNISNRLFSVKQQQTRYKQKQSNFLINRQTNISSVSSSSFLINYQSNNMLSRSSLSTTLRMLQYKQQNLSAIVHV